MRDLLLHARGAHAHSSTHSHSSIHIHSSIHGLDALNSFENREQFHFADSSVEIGVGLRDCILN